MKCEHWHSSNPRATCDEDAVTTRQYLNGLRHLCASCAKHADISSKLLEPIDKQIIKDLKSLSDNL